MKKWTLLGETTTPEGKKIALVERDGEYTVRLEGTELMSSRKIASEVRLGELGCAHIQKKAHARILIGGLGLGFTLKSVLANSPADAEITVAELIPQIVAWNRNPEYPLASAALSDTRVSVIEGDVVEVIRKAKNRYDSIVLDLDNGPSAFSSATNQRLYEFSGLHHVIHALRPGGCLAVWSVDESPEFVVLMKKAGFSTSVHHTRSHTTSGGQRTLFVGYVMPRASPHEPVARIPD